MYVCHVMSCAVLYMSYDVCVLCCAVLRCAQAYREHGKGQARAKKDSRNRNRNKKRAKAAAAKAKRAVPEVGLNLGGGWVSENSRAEQSKYTTVCRPRDTKLELHSSHWFV